MEYLLVALACSTYAWLGMMWGQRVYRTARLDRTEAHAMRVGAACGAFWPLSITLAVVLAIVVLIAAGKVEE